MALLYTWHYLEEVERLCDRIGIVDGGRMIAEGTRRELVDRIGRADRIELDVERDAERLAAACERLDASGGPGRRSVGWCCWRPTAERCCKSPSARGGAVEGVQVIEPDLEAVFLHLTGEALRD